MADILGAAGSIIGGLIGSGLSAADAARAQQLYTDSYNEIQNLGLPPDQTQRYILQKFQSAGLYTPQIEQAIKQAPSQVAQIKEDPSLRDAQMKALASLAQRGAGGLNPEDIAAYNQLRNKAAIDQQGRQKAILESAQRRGANPDGASLAAALISSQQGANQQAQAADDLSAQASRNALQAMSNYGTQAGQVRSQDFGVNQAKAQAADTINQFNANSAIGAQQRNVAAQNQGQQYNLNNAQQLSNANVGAANNETYNQGQRAVQYYNELAQRAQARSQNDRAAADQAAGQAANTRQNAVNIGTGIGGIASSVGKEVMGAITGNPGAVAAASNGSGIPEALKKYTPGSAAEADASNGYDVSGIA